MMNSMIKELPKVYEPHEHEDALYAQWMQSGFFNPDECVKQGVTDKHAESFSIVLPPPNVTGTLHMGHAVMLALQDCMVRFARMNGKKTVWIPGTDHAAIATQSKVEDILYKKEGKNRFQIGRKEFLKRVEQFAQESHDTIVGQIKKMGASIDWSREAYTLDDTRTHAVYTAFMRMYEDGLIYRGYKVVNWDPRGGTTVSDEEVVYKEEEATLYTFRYSHDFPIAIATTRPETKVGDTAIAVHPNDERYQQYIGQTFVVPSFAGKKLAITIIGDLAIDMTFGTGALGVTPAHSIVDAEMAERHSLKMVQVIDEYGYMNESAGEIVQFQKVLDARALIVQWLKDQQLLEKEESIVHNMSYAQRSGGAIEPLPKRQWFIAVKKEFLRNGKTLTLKNLMHEAVHSRSIRIIPERFNATYFHWIDNLRDWCISRQIWFGHTIPAWYCLSCDAQNIQIRLKKTLGAHVDSGVVSALLQIYTAQQLHTNIEYVMDVGGATPIVSLAQPDACPRCQNVWLVQDGDTLDTWFSAGLWTFSTLLWPQTTNELATFHPTSVMETGYDILFFWVARMILMSSYLLDEIPFRDVYLHGLIRASDGRKMSKSLDNIINPLDMIALYGTDATRLSLMMNISPGNDAKLSEEKVAGYRNFTNKLYNISRFVLMTTQEEMSEFNQSEYDALHEEDRWILGRLHEISFEVTRALQTYEFARAGDILKQFTWNEFADWYVEIAKIKTQKDRILRFVLRNLLIMWHPMMPFVTEYVWGLMGNSTLLMVEPWPSYNFEIDKKSIAHCERTQNVISTIRTLRNEGKISAKEMIVVFLEAECNDELERYRDIVMRLCRIEKLTIAQHIEKPENALTAVVEGITIYISRAEGFDKEKEVERLTSEIIEIEKYINRLELKLGNTQFIEKARREIVIAEQEKLHNAKEQRDALMSQKLSLARQ